MYEDRKLSLATELARVNEIRFVGMEPLESRVFCDHALAAAVVSHVEPRSMARAAIVANAGSTFATAQNVGTLTQTVGFRDALSPSKTNEYFRFAVTSTATVGLSLTGLSGNADLELFKAGATSGGSPQAVATSAHMGTMNESIGRKLSSGTYYVRVFENSGSAKYTLTLATSTAITKAPPPPPTTTPTNSGNLHIVFNYTYDTSGFFTAHPQAKTLLSLAANAFLKFTNVLSAITPGNGNTWSQTFADPGDPTRQITLNNLSIAKNTIVIYVGASSKMQATELGFGEPGGWSAMGTENFVETVEQRGQAGALKDTPTGYGPWGGAISFSNTCNWNLTTAAPTSSQNDFLSVATHEISHILGFGTSDSWNALVKGNTFVGRHSEAAYGGKPVPLAAGLQHWADGLKSTVDGVSQYNEMDPYLITGTRRAFTLLDYAGLEDVGWTV